MTVESDKCVLAGLCVQTAPDVFDQRERDGVVVLLAEYPSDDLGEAVEDAVLFCPARAIQLDAWGLLFSPLGRWFIS
ncbi:ferredoxin [Streptomyces sp. NBC_01506]|uniref:ferredoxin n=1 Tax=Streptomyces sp. NBC_01506 TaxID=2903887 RepID=UPI003870CA0C